MIYPMECYVPTEDAEGQHVVFAVLALRCSEGKASATLFLFLLRQLHPIIKVTMVLDLIGVAVLVHPLDKIFRPVDIA